jgi:hypothetical protein
MKVSWLQVTVVWQAKASHSKICLVPEPRANRSTQLIASRQAPRHPPDQPMMFGNLHAPSQASVELDLANLHARIAEMLDSPAYRYGSVEVLTDSESELS